MTNNKSRKLSITKKMIGLAACIVAALLMICAPVTARAAEAHSHNSKSFTAWTETDRLPASGGSYYLTDDVRLSSAWVVSGTVNLCLNGHSITYAGGGASQVVTVSSGSTLNLYDCQEASGCITGGTAGGVRAEGGSFNMYGGSISGNTGGPGLYLAGTENFITAQLSAGSITENKNEDGNGGGIYLDNNIWASLGKELSVSGNEAENGGGIYCGNMGYLSGSNCQIRDNHATESGGGIYVSRLGGAAVDYVTVADNTAGENGGGIYIHTTEGGLGASSITGGSITGNQAARNGGGVYYKIENDAELLELQLSGAVVIDRNSAGDERNNLYISDGSKITSYSALYTDAQIGITMETPGIFTRSYINNFNKTDPRVVFFSDSSGYEIKLTEDGKEAQLNPGAFYCITIADSEGGTVSSDHYSAAEGETITLSPKPEADYWIDHWEVTGTGGDVAVTDNQFTMPAYDVTVTGVFSQDALVQVESISLDKTELTFREGDSEGYQLTATVLPENALNKNITWSTSDAEVATVSNDGTVTAGKEGSAVITVTTENNQKTAGCEVTVLPPLFTVTFTDGQGNILQTLQVERGSAATPDEPVKEGYTFVGWDADFSNITADLTVNAIWKSDSAINYIDAAGNPLYQNEYTLINGNTESLSTGWYVVQESIDQQTNNIVRVNGNVNLILCDGKEYRVPKGIRVEGGNSLTIWCQEGRSGKLTCGGSQTYQPGIGASETHRYQGNITINGGWIEATGGPGAAGIGGAETSYGATVTINGGNVRAIGSTSLDCDGIGTGRGGQTLSSTTITGGTVYAEGKNGGAGIGRSHTDPGDYSKLTISGGKVTAIGHGGAGIGGKQRNSGENVSCGIVEITGGIVTAQSLPYNGNRSNAIGKGNSPEPYEYSDGSLDLSADRRVKAGADDISATYQSTEQRVDSAHKNAYAVIDTCTHDSKSFTITVDTHTWHCDHCEAAEAAAPHTFEDGVCTVCGARIYTVSFNLNGGSGSMAPVRVVGGTKYVLPQCAFTAPSGGAFTGWDYTGASEQLPGTEITVTQDLEISAHWSDLTWATLQTYINNAAPGSTITLDRDLTATSSDTALTIPQDSRITLDLNGHTLNRNLSSAKSGGSVLYIHPSQFTIKNGKLTGGFTTRGGGVLVNEYFNTAKSQSFNLININITGNTATEDGGGIYSDWGYGSVTGGSITNNHAWQRGGGVITAGSNWRLYINGTTISGNAAGIGGGIFAGETVILTDTVITGNRCAGQRLYYTFYPATSGPDAVQWTRWVVFEGGGVFVDSFNALEVRGSTRITDNVSAYSGSDRANNLFLRDRRGKGDVQNIDIVTSVEDLSADARIGITFETKDPPPDKWTTFPVPVTRNLPGNGALSNFFADESGYLLGLNSNGEVILGKTKRTVTLKPGEGGGQNLTETVLTNSQYIAPEKPNAFTAPADKELDGWKAENSETFYRVGAKINSVDRDLTLVAQWATPWQRLQDEIDRASNGATIKLDRDYTAVAGDTTLVIPDGKTITIDLNGHTLDGDSLKPGVINAGTETGAGATLAIKDTSADKSGKITGGSNGVTVYENSTFTLESGTITENAFYGADIRGGTFAMTGGEISGNLIGVYCGSNSTFTMSGGTVSGNVTGVSCDGTYKMTGGTVTENTSVGVACGKDGTFQMTKGTISDNESIGVDCNGNFTITGGTISGHPIGVTLRQNAVMNVGGASSFGGSLRITDNTKNVNLPADKTINRISTLIGVRIGVSTDAKLTEENPERIITSGLGNDATYVFLSDDPAYEVVRSSENENEAALKLIAPFVPEWNDPTYTWSEDNSSVTATRVCINDSSLTETETANATSIVTKEPTCTEKGLADYTAEFVNPAFETQTKKDVEIKELGHEPSGEFVIENLIEATCTEDGSYDRVTVCARCEAEMVRVHVTTPALGHDYQDVEGTAVKETCTEAGKAADQKCSRCDSTIDGAVIPALGHDWGEWTVTKEATETEEGKEERICSLCRAVDTRVIPIAEHVHRVTKVSAKDPTCSEEGNIEYYICDQGDHPCRHYFAADEEGEITIIYKETRPSGEEPEEQEITAKEVSFEETIKPATGHKWDEGKTTLEPGCTSYGVRTFTCTVCGAEREEAIDWPGHENEWVDETITPVTCDHSGYHWHVYRCKVCGEIMTKQLVKDEAPGHDYQEVAGSAKKATCTEDGKEADQKCSRCDSTIEGAVIPALGHAPGAYYMDNLIPSTCTEGGSYDRVTDCSRCGDELARTHVTTPALGHDYQDVEGTAVGATCTEDGKEADQKCSRCDSTIEGAVIPALGHSWGEWSVTKEATETEEGEEERTCGRCGEAETRVIPAKMHVHHVTEVSAKDPTCSEKGNIEYYICDKGENPCSHYFVADETGPVTIIVNETDPSGEEPAEREIRAREISYEETILPTLEHSWDECTVTAEATCTADGVMTYTCSVCGETKKEPIESTGHDNRWHDETIIPATCDHSGYHWHIYRCEVCGEIMTKQLKKDEAPGHDYQVVAGSAKEATCTEDGKEADQKCSRCGSTTPGAVIPALGHDYHLDEKSAKAATCTEDGKEADQKCSRCGSKIEGAVIPALGHVPSDTFVIENRIEATCTEGGSYDRVTKCSRCEAELARTHVTTPALGHDYHLDEESAKTATCTEAGKKADQKCSRCDSTIEGAVIPALGHSWGEWRVTKEATETEEGEEARACGLCRAVETRVIPIAEHVHRVTKVEEKSATCTEEGNIEYFVCDQGDHPCRHYFAADEEGTITIIYKETQPSGEEPAEQEITVREVSFEETIKPASGHKWNEGKITLKPGCTSYGVRTFTCTVCGEEREEAIDWPGHDNEWVDETITSVTCDHSGYHWHIYRCKVCGEIMTKQLVKDEAPGHDYQEVAGSAKEATCTEDGKEADQKCSRCDSTIAGEVIPALGHSWGEWNVTKDATETEEGEEARTCGRCGEVETRVIPIAEHVHRVTKVEEKSATCTEEGNIEYYVCDQGENPCRHYFAADEDGTITIIYKETQPSGEEPAEREIRAREISFEETIKPASGHKWDEGKITLEPGCTSYGVRTFTCTVCGAEREEAIDWLGHDYQEVAGSAKEATCTEDGKEADQKCSRCDSTIAGAVIPALGHAPSDTFVIENRIEATCTEGGSYDRVTVCARCKAELARTHVTTPALGHDYHLDEESAKTATCTEAGKKADQKCSRCDSTIEGAVIPALGHSWGEWTVTKEATEMEEGEEERTCVRCDAVETRVIPAKMHVHHVTEVSAKDPTCSEKGNIEYYICDKGDHPCSHYFVADETGPVTIIINGTDPSGEEPAEREIRAREISYEETIKPATGHKWDEGEITLEPGCTSYGVRTFTCTVCGAEREEAIGWPGHENEWVDETIIPATCDHSGYHWHIYRCEVCGEIMTSRLVQDPMLGHDWSDWKVTKEPTSVEEGKETRVCSRCDATETRPIPKTDPENIEYRNTGGDAAVWTRGSSATVAFTFKRSVDDKKTIRHFTGILVDGNSVDASNYTAESGSVIITLKPKYLETLAVGKHTLTALFDDGNDSVAVFTVIAADDQNPDSKTDPENGSTTPDTGDRSGIPFFIALMLISLAVVVFLIVKRKKV